MLAAATTNMESKFMLKRGQAALEGADHACRDARRMPVHSHHDAKSLKPKRIGEPSQQFVASVMVNDGFRHDGAKTAHARGKPIWDLAVVER